MQTNTNTFIIIADAPSDIEIPEGKLIVLDGFANKLLNTNIIPYAIIGDLDQITNQAISHFKNLGVKIIKDSCQNSTDLDKGINFCDLENASEIHIHNALGGRIDHTLYNTRALNKHHNNTRRIKLFNNDEILEYFSDCSLYLRCLENEPIAIMSAPKAIVTSNGLKYELNNLLLEYGKTESSSNTTLKKLVTLEIIGRSHIIYKKTSCLTSKH